MHSFLLRTWCSVPTAGFEGDKKILGAFDASAAQLQNLHWGLAGTGPEYEDSVYRPHLWCFVICVYGVHMYIALLEQDGWSCLRDSVPSCPGRQV